MQKKLKTLTHHFEKRKTLIFFSFTLVISFLIPEVLLAFVAANLALCIIVLILRFQAVLLPRKVMEKKNFTESPKISIHVPTYNEPPEVVISTIKALQNLHYENYEVIVLDNNTSERKFWTPVRDFVHSLADERIRFFHYENVKGYKAGALNICLKHTHPDADFLLVIDADYQVDPELINEAVTRFSTPEIGLVQFPQAYYNTANENQGITDEYEHFFSVYMNMANHRDCVLSTGTVSFIRLEALHKAGGWQDKTITEDVELGLRLKNAGYQGKYIANPLGRGLMPTDARALRTQRERWIYGNMQTLSLFLKSGWKNFKVKQTLGIVTMLTAWFNFLFFPIIGIVVAGILGLSGTPDVVHTLMPLSIGSIGVYTLGTMFFFLLAFKGNVKRSLGAFLVHVGLAYEGAVSWLTGLLKTNLGFKRTNKFPQLGKWSHFMPGLVLTLFVLLVIVFQFLSADLLAACISLSMIPLVFATFYLKKQVEATARITTEKMKP